MVINVERSLSDTDKDAIHQSAIGSGVMKDYYVFINQNATANFIQLLNTPEDRPDLIEKLEKGILLNNNIEPTYYMAIDSGADSDKYYVKVFKVTNHNMLEGVEEFEARNTEKFEEQLSHIRKKYKGIKTMEHGE